MEISKKIKQGCCMLLKNQLHMELHSTVTSSVHVQLLQSSWLSSIDIPREDPSPVHVNPLSKDLGPIEPLSKETCR